MIGKAPRVVSTAKNLSLSTPHGNWTAEKVGWRICVDGKFVMFTQTKEKAKAYILELSKREPNQIVTMDVADEYTATLQ